MGRTVMSFIFVVEEERERWREFRRSLPKEDREAFDRLFDQAKFHTPAVGYMSHPLADGRLNHAEPLRTGPGSLRHFPEGLTEFCNPASPRS